ncbi:MAG: DUF3048 domain-containing protein [Clostridia bacterium]|nr:DUF3048 domain-containing protein [Clostridia bacterium]
MKSRIIACLLAVLLVAGMTSCDKLNELIDPFRSEQETETEPETVPETFEIIHADYTDPITGEPTETDLSGSRPIAIVIKNDRVASPQFGLSRAAVIYEALVEGGLTRFLAVYSDIGKLDKVGPVIDSRSYFYDFATNHNAVFVQAGTTTEGNKIQVERGITALDAIVGDMSPGFYRDATLKTTRGSENSIVTDSNGLRSRANSFGVKLKVDVQMSPYSVEDYLENRDMTGGNYCTHLSIPFSANMTVEYSYSTLTNTYSRSQYGEPHLDASTGKQLAFTNLMILICDYITVNTKTGEMKIINSGRGSGYYVYGGSVIMITWQRTNGATPIKLYEADGITPLRIASGNTYIAVASPKLSGKISFE